jgi:anti-anti-sigma regulatory factor
VILVAGVLDGSSAMELTNRLRDERRADIALDFSGISRIEAFGIEVLVRELARLRAAGARIHCRGLPPRAAARFDEEGIVVT